MKVLGCGSRTWTNRRVVREWLSQFPPGTVVVHGDARGADTLIDIEARRLGFVVRPYPAEWDAHGKAAGPKRNSKMLREEHPDKEGVFFDLVGAFTNDLEKSTGTRDMVRKSLNAGVQVDVFDEAGERIHFDPLG